MDFVQCSSPFSVPASNRELVDCTDSLPSFTLPLLPQPLSRSRAFTNKVSCVEAIKAIKEVGKPTQLLRASPPVPSIIVTSPPPCSPPTYTMNIESDGEFSQEIENIFLMACFCGEYHQKTTSDEKKFPRPSPLPAKLSFCKVGSLGGPPTSRLCCPIFGISREKKK